MELLEYNDFVVVEFVDEQQNDIVANSWLTVIDKQLYAYWPPNYSQKRAFKKEIPDKAKWSCHRVRVIASSDDFEKAKVFNRRAELTSNVESSPETSESRRKKMKKCFDSGTEADADADDVVEHHPRKRQKVAKTVSGTESGQEQPLVMPIPTPYERTATRALFHDSVDDDNSKSSKSPGERTTTPQPAGASSKSPGKRTTTPQPAGASSKSPGERTTTPQPAGASSKSPGKRTTTPQTAGASSKSPGKRTTTQQPASASNKSPGKRTTTPQPAGASSKSPGKRTTTTQPAVTTDDAFQPWLRRTLSSQQEQLDEILRLVRSIVQQQHPDTEEFVFERKITNDEELEELNIRLANKDCRKQMINYLSSLGGTDLADIIRRMFRRLIDNKCLSNFSMQGFKKKKTFRDLPLCEVIIVAVRRATQKKYSHTEIESKMSTILSEAPRAPGGPLHKVSAKPTCGQIPAADDSDD